MGDKYIYIGFPGGSVLKNLFSVQETQVQSLGQEGNGNSFQYACLGNPMDRGAWWAKSHGSQKRHKLATKTTTKPIQYCKVKK